MKKKIIEIFVLAGYEFIKEEPEDRLLFYDVEQEQNIQFWIPKRESMQKCIEVIKRRSFDYGKSIGQSSVQNEIRNALGF